MPVVVVVPVVVVALASQLLRQLLVLLHQLLHHALRLERELNEVLQPLYVVIIVVQQPRLLPAARGTGGQLRSARWADRTAWLCLVARDNAAVARLM